MEKTAKMINFLYILYFCFVIIFDTYLKETNKKLNETYAHDVDEAKFLFRKYFL